MPTPAIQGNDSERVLGVIEWMFKQGFLGVESKIFSAVITTQRMIFAQLTSEMRKKAWGLAKEKVKAEDQGFFSGVHALGARIKAASNYYKKYLSMEPSTILSEAPGNFAVDNNDVKEIKVRQIGGNLEPPGFTMEIKSSKAKYKFEARGLGKEFEARLEEYIKLLKQVYGARVDFLDRGYIQ